MIKKTTLIIIIVGSLVAGCLWYAFEKELIIFNFNQSKTNQIQDQITYKKNITFVWRSHEKFASDEIPILLSQDRVANITNVISRWLGLIYQEKVIATKTNMQSVLISYDGTELFISFDRNFLNQNDSIFEKWMLIESLLQTIAATDTAIKKVRFLQDHAPLCDTHLDFTCAWPVQGFLNK